MESPFTKLGQIHDDKASKIIAEERHVKVLQSQQVVSDTILAATTSLIKYLNGHTTKTEIVNQLKSINTPDSLAVIPHINSLNETMKGLKNTDLTEITSVMTSILGEVKNIPKENIEIPESEKQIDYSDQFNSLKDCVKCVEAAVKEQKLIAEAPVVNVPETVLNIEKPDLEPLQKSLKGIIEAVKNIVIPEYKTDNEAVEKLISLSNKLLKDILEKPVSSGGGGGGRVTPYQDANGIPAFVSLVGGSIPVSNTGFSPSSNITTTISADGNTIVETDGVKIKTTTISGLIITEVWS